MPDMGLWKGRVRDRIAWRLTDRLEQYPGRLLVVIGARSPQDLSFVRMVVVWPPGVSDAPHSPSRAGSIGIFGRALRRIPTSAKSVQRLLPRCRVYPAIPERNPGICCGQIVNADKFLIGFIQSQEAYRVLFKNERANIVSHCNLLKIGEPSIGCDEREV
jgi:hypothetical protein